MPLRKVFPSRLLATASISLAAGIPYLWMLAGPDLAPASAAVRPRADQPEAADEPSPQAQVVGRALCSGRQCHDNLMAEFDQVRHTHYLSRRRLGDAAGCEVCHGPASEHLQEPAHRKIPRFSMQTPENARRVNETCLKCHADTVRRSHYDLTAHARAGLSCASCHEVHTDLGTPFLLRLPGARGPSGSPGKAHHYGEPAQPGAPPSPVPAASPFLAARQRVPLPSWRSSFRREESALSLEETVNDLCLSCHRRVSSEARQISHHPLLEARMKCTGCHDVHSPPALRGTEAMLTGTSVAETCLRCHEEIRGPFLFEHDPVKAGGIVDDCLECHRPHGSSNRKLTLLFGTGVCLQCHTDIRADPAHRSRGGTCWRAGCHVALHGSNHSEFFLR